MLTLLTPFILGIIIQVSAIIGADVAAPKDDHKIETKISRDEFAYRLDKAVFAPSFFTLLSAALLNHDRLSETVVTLIVIGAVAAFMFLAYRMSKSDATAYRLVSIKFLGITPLNLGVIITNVILGGLTFFTASPEHEPAKEATAHRPTAVSTPAVSRSVAIAPALSNASRPSLDLDLDA